MASKRIYTRSNHDPNPPTIVDNPNTIFRGIQGSSTQLGTPLHKKSLSSEVLRSPEYKNFDDKIQKVSFRSENEKELTEIVLDLKRKGIDTSSLVNQKDKEEF